MKLVNKHLKKVLCFLFCSYMQLYVFSKHSNQNPKHGLLKAGTTYAGFYLNLNIFWKNSTNISGNWPRSTLWGKYVSLPPKNLLPLFPETNKKLHPPRCRLVPFLNCQNHMVQMNGKPEMTWCRPNLVQWYRTLTMSG